MSRSPRLGSLVRHEIAFRVSQDHVAHRLVVFDIAGAAAEVTVERIGDGLLEFGAFHRCVGQTFQQDLALVQEAGRAIAALERKCAIKAFWSTESSPFFAWPSTVRIALPSKLAAEVTQVGLV